MRHYAVLRILLAGFLLYIAWPQIPLASSQLGSLFWGVWLLLLVLVLGSNLATLLQMTRPPILEQDRQLQRKTLKH